MPGFHFNEKFYETDEDGYLQKLEDWNEAVAEYIAKTEEIDMDEDRWKVVKYLREYYEQYKIAPMIRVVLKWIGEEPWIREREQQVPLRALSQWTRQAGVQDCRYGKIYWLCIVKPYKNFFLTGFTGWTGYKLRKFVNPVHPV